MALQTQQKQRTELTIEEKIDIIKSIKNKKHSYKELQDLYKVSKYTISRILAHEDQLMSSRNSQLRRIRSGHNKDIDTAITKWYNSMREQNIFVNGPLVRQQAIKFARMMNNNSFKATNGWLWRWQRKQNVKFTASSERTRARAEYRAMQIFGDVDPNAGWTELDWLKSDQQQQQEGLAEGETSVQSFGDSNASIKNEQGDEDDLCYSEIEIKKEEVQNPFEADVCFDVESDADDNFQDRLQREDGGNGHFHLGLENHVGEMESTVTLKCFLCHQSGQVCPFNDETFERCLNTLQFRRMKNFTDIETELNVEDKHNFGFHRKCYKSFVSITHLHNEEFKNMFKKSANYNENSKMPFVVSEFKEEPKNQLSDAEKKFGSHPMKMKMGTSSNENDIYSIYGEYIARRLRESAKERENCEIYIAQHNIDDVIFKLSMGFYARDKVKAFENTANDLQVEKPINVSKTEEDTESKGIQKQNPD